MGGRCSRGCNEQKGDEHREERRGKEMANSSCSKEKDDRRVGRVLFDACSHTYTKVRVPRVALAKCHTRVLSIARAARRFSPAAFGDSSSRVESYECQLEFARSKIAFINTRDDSPGSNQNASTVFHRLLTFWAANCKLQIVIVIYKIANFVGHCSESICVRSSSVRTVNWTLLKHLIDRGHNVNFLSLQ